ncbi:FecCD family ABC transporter permease [Stigmatella aurantiaca]|uniref:ABC-type hemin transport system, permease component, HutC n=3 Tax=Stigmatella aurantiaca TaxID=41 RepID=E3FDW2_STIAD|nr:iron ABC transporter permease [Stigmatella aurantiaca]ADO71377.1 ABC-type hemin transport system, permease component, HutC [Stigmatella aurantiaca DW4/3-1]
MKPGTHPSLSRGRRAKGLLVLVPLLGVCVILSLGVGAVKIAPLQVVSILLERAGLEPLTAFSDQQAAVLYAIRLPRVLLGVLVGAALAVAGAAMQGLFRNPLADPGLLGISSGASLGVAACTVLKVYVFGFYTLSIAAFVGSLLSILAISSLAQENRRTNVTMMLLCGIAINALCIAGTGLFTYLSTDDQLRTITFWQLGSLASATWTAVSTAAPLILLCTVGMLFLASPLNALLLGEANADHLGINVERVKWTLVALVALGVGAAVAVSGMIGFVGLVVPHLIRLWLGPNHRVLLPLSALLGAVLMVLADLVARTIVVPSELPIGIVTSLTGSPFFLYLLMRQRRTQVL